MKIYFYIVVLIFIITNLSKADTLSYWHVYFNYLKLKEYAEYSNLSNDLIKLDQKEIKQNDTLSVIYYSDTPCFSCKTSIYIIDEKKKNITLGQSVGEQTPLRISVFDLMKNIKQNEANVYYSSDKFDGAFLIFNIKLE